MTEYNRAPSVAGRYFLISGSANAATDPEKLERAHQFVREIVRQLILAGGGVVALASSEPAGPSGQALIFDWTVLRAVEELAKKSLVKTKPVARVVTAARIREKKVAAANNTLLNRLTDSGLVRLEELRDGLYSGPRIVGAHVGLAHGMIAIGGGKGVSVLVDEFRQRSRPVFATDLSIGSILSDGGGALDAHRGLMVKPHDFLPGVYERERLLGLSLENPIASVPEIAEKAVSLLALSSRDAPQDHRAREASPPRCALILRGGGAKGLAYAGAIQELELYYNFDTYVGASAGAIAATLLAAGLDGRELERELRAKNTSEFMDASPIRAVMNLLRKGGLFEGNDFLEWMKHQLGQRIARSEVRLCDLPKRAMIYISEADRGTRLHDGRGDHAETVAAYAVRMSMSYPVAFVPMPTGDGRRGYDGGVGNNFPVRDFRHRHPDSEFVGMVLSRMDPPHLNKKSVFGELFGLVTEQDEQQVVDEYRPHVVIIDPSPIETLDFALSDDEKTHLILQGRLGAARFLVSKGRWPEERAPELAELDAEAQAVKLKVVEVRRRALARKHRLAVGAMAVLLAGAAALALRHRFW